VAEVCGRARRLLAHRHHLLDQVHRLSQELAAGLAELSEDESWVQGAAGRAEGTAGRDAQCPRRAGGGPTAGRDPPGSRPCARTASRRQALKALQQMLAELGELDQHTGRFSDGMLRYAETVQNAQSLESLAEVVREMVAESRSVHGLVSATRGRLQDEHRRASELETQVRALEAELRRLSDEVATDALTQVANRRGLMQQFEVEQARIAREGTSLAIGLLDIDNFKRLNDTLGHSAGDEALKALAEHVRSSLRPVDAVARFGGEEFVVLLPGTPVDEAQQVLTRLQRQLSASLFMHENKEVFVTFSAGVTQYRAGESWKRRWSAPTRPSTRPSAPARTAPAWADRPAALRFSGCDRGRDGPPPAMHAVHMGGRASPGPGPRADPARTGCRIRHPAAPGSVPAPAAGGPGSATRRCAAPHGRCGRPAPHWPRRSGRPGRRGSPAGPGSRPAPCPANGSAG
jgi:diguanylate cyclase (GGDEF)-like protein